MSKHELTVPAKVRTGVALALALCASAAFACDASVLAGDWRGAYVRGGAAQVITLHVNAASTALTASYSVPDLGVQAAKADIFECENDVVRLKAVYGLFTLHLDTAGAEMTGENSRWNPVMTLHLRKAIVPIDPKYVRRPFDFRNGAVRLHGELYLPPGKGPFRAFVLVHGSGPQGLADDFYRFWAEFLVQFDVAVLAYDKRGVGGSSGDYGSATLEMLASDAAAAVRALVQAPSIRHDDIGLAGLSQGGWIAPIAATRVHVARLLLVSAPAVSVQQQELDRVESTLRADEVPADSIAEALEYTRAMFEAVRDSSQWSELQRLTEASREKPWFSTVAAPASMEDLAGWRPIYAFDPAETLRRIAVPTLAIYGEADTIVPPHKNAALLQSLLGQRGAAVQVVVIPNAGHSLETFATLKGDEWKWPDSHWVFPRKAPELLQIVREWLAP